MFRKPRWCKPLHQNMKPVKNNSCRNTFKSSQCTAKDYGMWFRHFYCRQFRGPDDMHRIMWRIRAWGNTIGWYNTHTTINLRLRSSNVQGLFFTTHLLEKRKEELWYEFIVIYLFKILFSHIRHQKDNNLLDFDMCFCKQSQHYTLQNGNNSHREQVSKDQYIRPWGKNS